MSEIKKEIISILNKNKQTLFPTESPETIADKIISLFATEIIKLTDDSLELENELEDLTEQNRLLTVRCQSISSSFVAPSLKNAIDYILLKELMKTKSVNQISETAELFINYYESVGWVVGKAKKPMKSWAKALNNWCKRDWNKKSGSSAKVHESIKAYMLLQKSKNQ